MSAPELQRSKIYEDVITVPATIAAAAATWTSDEIYPFEQTGYGAAKVSISVADASKVTGAFDVKAYVSFDEGTTWELASTNSAVIANGTGAAADVLTITYAPRLKVELVNGGTDELAAAHGTRIHVQMEESLFMSGEREISTSDTVFFEADGGPGYSSVITCDNIPYQVTMIATADDLSEVTDGTGGLAYVLQSSMDGINYWTITGTPKTDIANGSGTLFSATTETTKLGKYFRVMLYDTNAAVDAALTEAAGVNFTLISVK